MYDSRVIDEDYLARLHINALCLTLVRVESAYWHIRPLTVDLHRFPDPHHIREVCSNDAQFSRKPHEPYQFSYTRESKPNHISVTSCNAAESLVCTLIFYISSSIIFRPDEEQSREERKTYLPTTSETAVDKSVTPAPDRLKRSRMKLQLCSTN
jgi:hypothetical protein